MKLNPEMVTLAREYRGYTQEEVGDKTGFSQPKVARLGNGSGADVDVDELDRLSNALAFPKEFFLQDEVRLGFGSSSYYFRKKSSLSASDRKRIQSVVNLMRIHIKRMLGAIDFQVSKSFRSLDLEDYCGRPELVAQAVRDYWKLPEGPISNLTALVEAAGVIVVQCDFGTREIDGTSLWIGEMPPLVFLRSDLPGDRWRWTLCHEIAHLIMHEVPTETMEKEADRFAAEFLMPESDIKQQLQRIKRIGLDDMARLKPYWKVAMQSILRRSLDLGYTDHNQARYLYQRMGSLGYRTREPVDIEREAPQTVTRLFDCFTNDMGYDGDSLGEYLRMFKGDIESLYGLKFRSGKVEKPKLKIVS